MLIVYTKVKSGVSLSTQVKAERKVTSAIALDVSQQLVTALR